VVGLGVGVYAGIRERRESIRDIVMTDLCPFTLGTSVANSSDDGSLLYSPIIERNSILPCSRLQRYCTAADSQSQVIVDIYQGEERYSKDNLKLGELTVPVPNAPAGKESVDIRFTYDINGILEVEVTVVSTGKVYRELLFGKDTAVTEKEARQRLKELSQVKLPPQNREGIRALVARGERLYAQSTGREREKVGQALNAFLLVASTQAPTALARKIKDFGGFLASVEKYILGVGIFPSDVSEEDAASQEENIPGQDPSGSDSGPPLQ